jgi:pyrroline-5-carboxylate reductase
MLNDELIVFIGPGVMAEAMVGGLVERAGVSPARIRLSGPREARLKELESRFGVGTASDNHAAVQGAGIVVISVKPQSLRPALENVRGAVPKDALVLSIVAGAPLAQLGKLLDHGSIVRAMPNTPGQVGEGISVWAATESVSVEQRDHARAMLAALGQEIYVEDEDYLDMATALSGTGPAYVYLFMEAMVDAGVHLGFPRRIAEQLVAQTVKGSVSYYLRSPRHLARLRNQVTSPGGTSAAALYYLEKAGFRTALSRAIWAAYERSVQLGLGKKRGPVSE